MLATPSPLTERMTLFWHNHFVSSQQKVRFARLMYRQNATFRAHALGDFACPSACRCARAGDARLSRRRAESPGTAERELRARVDGAVHARRRPLHRAGRARSGACFHRLVARPRDRRIPFRPALHDRGVEDGARSHRTLRRRRDPRYPACAPGDREVHRHEAVARVRRAGAGCRGDHSASPTRFGARTTRSRSRCASF